MAAKGKLLTDPFRVTCKLTFKKDSSTAKANRQNDFSAKINKLIAKEKNKPFVFRQTAKEQSAIAIATPAAQISKGTKD